MAQLGIGSPSPGNRPRNNNSGLDDNSGLADLLDLLDANDLPSTSPERITSFWESGRPGVQKEASLVRETMEV